MFLKKGKIIENLDQHIAPRKAAEMSKLWHCLQVNNCLCVFKPCYFSLRFATSSTFSIKFKFMMHLKVKYAFCCKSVGQLCSGINTALIGNVTL